MITIGVRIGQRHEPSAICVAEAEERRSMGEWWFAQEYGCEFLDAETQPFGREDVERAFEEEVEAWAL